MDVTHIPHFGNLRYAHVSIDTCSGVMHAILSTREKAHNVMTHCLEAWAAWGKPKHLKTDNGPAYTAKSCQSFCQTMQVHHSTGLPYNPQGQGTVERAHRTLKELLQKQKEGTAYGRTPKEQLSIALFTLNFLILDTHGHNAADRHAASAPVTKLDVKWKDVLTNKWYGPDPVISRSRGAVCIFPQDKEDPIWVPERLTRKVPPIPPKDATVADVLINSNQLLTQVEPRWGILSVFPRPMLIRHDAKLFPHLFSSNKTFDVPYLPLDNEIADRRK